MKKNSRKINRGQSLVSVIIAAGVGAIVLGFLTDMLVQQGISQKFISQKLELNDLTANLITTFSRSENCACQFSSNAAINPNDSNYNTYLKFNSAVTNGTQVIDVKKLYAGCNVGTVMPLLIAEEGLPLPNF